MMLTARPCGSREEGRKVICWKRVGGRERSPRVEGWFCTASVVTGDGYSIGAINARFILFFFLRSPSPMSPLFFSSC